MEKIRVLVVDDSVVIRSTLREVFAADPTFEVAGVAANGRIAVAMLDQVNPDLVTLDVEMPEMNGLDTLTAIRSRHPKLPVIMFSTLTARGAAETIEALSRGATDYVTKPVDAANFQQAVQQIREQLLPRARELSVRNGQSKTTIARPGAMSTRRPPKAAFAPVEAVVIGASTGGPNALTKVFSSIPGDFPVPVLVVQHMPPVFTRFLAERLSACGGITVREAVSGIAVVGGEAWIAPGDHHLAMLHKGGRAYLVTQQDPPEHSCRPSVDVLFRSAAEIYGRGLLAVIMTGMGQDGLAGCERVRNNGGRVLVQDQATSVVWGMPGFVANAGLADEVLPIEQIGPEIMRLVCGTAAQARNAAGAR